MVCPPGPVAGRERECAAIERLLARGRDRHAALLLEGEAGIGKSTVFRHGLTVAAGDGCAVLACRPAFSEMTLSLCAVSDLLEAVPPAYWLALSAPQRRALDVVMLRADPGEAHVDQRAIAAGLRSLVTALAIDRRVLLAVDDVQWLDPASAAILGYLVRRLGPESVAVLATRRLPEPTRLDLGAVVPPGALAREQLGPLSLGALQRVLRARLRFAPACSTLARIHAAARGNPLFALEIARVLSERGATGADEPLPVPDDIRELVQARVEALPAETKNLLLGAALLAQPAIGPLQRALGKPIAAALEPAERIGVARLDGAAVAFAHPLHAAAVVATATAAERRRMHMRLADAAASPEERAHHLAHGAERRDEAIARALEQGAAAARARGDLHAAAELLERARMLTSANVRTAQQRGVRAAELHLHVGDRERARRLLEELLAEGLAPAERGTALRLLAELRYCEEDLAGSVRLLTEAIRVEGDPRSAARARLDLAYVKTTDTMDFAASAELAAQARDCLPGDADQPLLAEALAYSAMADYLAGRGVDWLRVKRALELEDPDRIALMGMPVGGVAGCLLLYVGRHAEARERLNTVRERLAERGDWRDLAPILLWLSFLETRCADFAAAERFADESVTCADLAGHEAFRRWAIAQRAWVHAHRGSIDQALRGCVEALPSDGHGIVQVGLSVAATRVLAGLSVGDAESAWDACRPFVERIEHEGIAEPVPAFFLPDALEALVILGDLDRASAILDEFERSAREHDRVWALASGGRCRGLILAARGELPGAVAALDAARAQQRRIVLPFDRARTLLAKGVTERRARRRAHARASLAEAAAEFERLGAALWAERARGELHRTAGGRRDGHGLTPSERRAAELAAAGFSNKEIAARLVVSVHTVEVHLSRSYAKLGISSRSRLARRLKG